MRPTRKRYSFWINDTEAEGLKVVKGTEGITESEQIRQAIRDWLRKKGVQRVAVRPATGLRRRPRARD